ncbi:MAG: small-conductance mechanosensitive channel [Planctomycetota bacterium]
MRNLFTKPTATLRRWALKEGPRVGGRILLVLPLQNLGLDVAPQALVTALGDSSVNLSTRACVSTREYFRSCGELRRSIKLRFDEEGVSIPYPQRDVYVRTLPVAAPTA